MLKPINDNILLKETMKKGSIIISTDKSNPAASGAMVDSVEVLAIGDKVKKVKKGDNVLINKRIFYEPGRIVDKEGYNKSKNEENEMYIIVKEEEIVGIY